MPARNWGWKAILLLGAVWWSGNILHGQTRVELPTVAEASGFRRTATGMEVERFLREIASATDEATLLSLGTTVEGRKIWALDVAATGHQTGDAGTLTVLLLGGIHAGECDGKEALLALARDITLVEKSVWRQSLRLIFVPNFNADGNERRSRHHRPGQSGPSEGMGVRHNAQRLDLNRDFIKLESPEVRALVGAINRFDVDVLIDLHTTNGSLHQYDLTYAIPHHPAANRTLTDWARQELMPSVSATLSRQGFTTFFYGNFDAAHTRWQTFGHEPRYSTEYMGLRGKLGILVESYSYKSYRRRIEASYAFVRTTLAALHAHATQLRENFQHERSVPRAGSTLATRARLALTSPSITIAGFKTPAGELVSPPYDASALQANVPTTFTVSWWGHAEPTMETDIPVAYAIDPDGAWAVQRLMLHGIQVHRLSVAGALKARQLRVTRMTRESEKRFGHHRLLVDVEEEPHESLVAAGSFVVATDQPLGKLAAYLLEPSSEDGLTAWNFFDPHIVSGQLHPVQRVVSGLPETGLSLVEVLSAHRDVNSGQALSSNASDRVRG
ncbi:MAG: hypothetical protein KatS3mg111_3662 [Pirellulaceae bacterium]|nr:MAG: hypothetical protein KatS3mg111_3662 [Pirellulaceae bacterium]